MTALQLLLVPILARLAASLGTVPEEDPMDELGPEARSVPVEPATFVASHDDQVAEAAIKAIALEKDHVHGDKIAALAAGTGVAAGRPSVPKQRAFWSVTLEVAASTCEIVPS